MARPTRRQAQATVEREIIADIKNITKFWQNTGNFCVVCRGLPEVHRAKVYARNGVIEVMGNIQIPDGTKVTVTATCAGSHGSSKKNVQHGAKSWKVPVENNVAEMKDNIAAFPKLRFPESGERMKFSLVAQIGTKSMKGVFVFTEAIKIIVQQPDRPKRSKKKSPTSRAHNSNSALRCQNISRPTAFSVRTSALDLQNTTFPKSEEGSIVNEPGYTPQFQGISDLSLTPPASATSASPCTFLQDEEGPNVSDAEYIPQFQTIPNSILTPPLSSTPPSAFTSFPSTEEGTATAKIAHENSDSGTYGLEYTSQCRAMSDPMLTPSPPLTSETPNIAFPSSNNVGHLTMLVPVHNATEVAMEQQLLFTTAALQLLSSLPWISFVPPVVASHSELLQKHLSQKKAVDEDDFFVDVEN